MSKYQAVLSESICGCFVTTDLSAPPTCLAIQDSVSPQVNLNQVFKPTDVTRKPVDAPDQWFSNASRHHNHLKGLLKCRVLGFMPGLAGA